MQLKNSETRYGAVTKSFHWVMALLILTLLAVGLTMEDLEPLKLKLQVYGLHKSFGVLVLILAFVRIAWHIASKKPAFVAGLKAYEKTAARAVHAFLYIAMFGMPVSGWLMSSAAGRTVSFFGLCDLPNFVTENEGLRDTFGTIHEFLGYTLIIGIAAHVAGALRHHFISKDATLRRMLPFVKGD